MLGHAEVRQTLQGHRRGHRGRLLCAGRQDRSARTARSAWSGTASSSTRAYLASLQRFKDSVKEVAAGYECGMTIEKFNDIKEGDIVEAFTMEEIPQ